MSRLTQYKKINIMQKEKKLTLLTLYFSLALLSCQTKDGKNHLTNAKTYVPDIENTLGDSGVLAAAIAIEYVLCVK